MQRTQEGTMVEIFPEGKEKVTFSGGFHNAEISVPYDHIESYESQSGLRVTLTWLSERDYNKANRAFCGMSDCTCGSGLQAVDQKDGLIAVEAMPDEFSGEKGDQLLPDPESVTERRIIISLPASMDDALRERAHKLRISLAEAVRRAVGAWQLLHISLPDAPSGKAGETPGRNPRRGGGLKAQKGELS
jgi:hypothetical protein